ncbi:hypothetical protein CTI12_AA235740 [Artemisia annua]|uniref:YEATS domain-containing protein n=1 Tax=Artemisia annua TaxID=35608 RepID=A0A2U1NS96_ARTAN|nr:hypothetical protein CTI12_AA235740 [Artemisia annua]
MNVYVHGTTNDDLGVVIKKLVFQLHPSFNNATLEIDSPPFKLTAREWAPIEDLHGNKSGDTKDHPLVNISTDILSEADELFELAEARQQIAVKPEVDHTTMVHMVAKT